MRIVFIGAVEFSEALLKKVLAVSGVEVVGVVTRSHSNFNADFRDLAPLAHSKRIPVFYADQQTPENMEAFIASREPDVIFCFGWSFLLKESILKLPRLGCIGYHPAQLPKNRGRHPIIWALALGLRETASTFLLLDGGVDSGPIVSQVTVPITEEENARSLYEKLLRIAEEQVVSLTEGLREGTVEILPQDAREATYLRKRGKEDGLLHWDRSKREIHNLVRALSDPYPGAHFENQGKEIKVWKTTVVSDTVKAAPGTVVAQTQNTFDVQCTDGILRVLEHDLKEIPKEGTVL